MLFRSCVCMRGGERRLHVHGETAGASRSWHSASDGGLNTGRLAGGSDQSGTGIGTRPQQHHTQAYNQVGNVSWCILATEPKTGCTVVLHSIHSCCLRVARSVDHGLITLITLVWFD